MSASYETTRTRTDYLVWRISVTYPACDIDTLTDEGIVSILDAAMASGIVISDVEETTAAEVLADHREAAESGGHEGAWDTDTWTLLAEIPGRVDLTDDPGSRYRLVDPRQAPREARMLADLLTERAQAAGLTVTPHFQIDLLATEMGHLRDAANDAYGPWLAALEQTVLAHQDACGLAPEDTPVNRTWVTIDRSDGPHLAHAFSLTYAGHTPDGGYRTVRAGLHRPAGPADSPRADGRMHLAADLPLPRVSDPDTADWIITVATGAYRPDHVITGPWPGILLQLDTYLHDTTA